MFKIRDIAIDNPIIVAPMAGISNDAFRQLCFEFSAGLVYAEMVSDKAIYYDNRKTMDMLYISEDTHPVAMQLFGSEASTMVYAAKFLDDSTDCDIIDINMGCPVNKVVKTGAGSAMMRNEDETAAIVAKIVSAVKKPVTVKMRLGWDLQHLNYLSLARKLQDAGVSAIALHARTRSQMYEGHADWSHIRILKDALSIPVIGNGDVKSVDDFIEMRKQCGCDGVMIGRGLLGDPFLIKAIHDHLQGKPGKTISDEERLAMCLEHADKLVRLKGEKLAMSQMRGLAPHYLSGMYGASAYKNKLNQIKELVELQDIIAEYREYLQEHRPI